MQKKLDAHSFTGMRFDLEPIRQPADCLIDAHNIRFITEDNSSFMSISPEKGTEHCLLIANEEDLLTPDNGLKGEYLGHQVVGKYIVVFTQSYNSIDNSNIDYIYRLELNNDDIRVDCLFEGNLNFDIEHPIQSISSIEEEFIQKVYWVDGKNSTRFINIVEDKYKGVHCSILRELKDSNSYNFIQELQLNEDVSVTKNFNSLGMFPSGSIQYALSYYNKYGQETNLVWTSPLYYTSFIDRAGSPEENCNCYFKITINNLDFNYEYIKLYSIIRTSLNTTPIVKVVKNVQISDRTIAYDNFSIYHLNQGIFFNSINTATEKDIINNPEKYKLTLVATPKGERFFLSKDNKVYNASNYKTFRNFDIVQIPDTNVYEYVPNNEALENGIYYSTSSIGLDRGYYKIIEFNNGYSLQKAELKEKILTSITLTDYNTEGYTIDPQQLLFLGGEDIIAGTIASKNNTLFLGNIEVNKQDKLDVDTSDLVVTEDYRTVTYTASQNKLLAFSLTALEGDKLVNPSTFKYREYYRLGLQFQYKDGSWSTPIYIKDHEVKNKSNQDDLNKSDLLKDYINVKLPILKTTYDFSYLKESGFKKVRPIIVKPEVANRRIIAQGFCNKTIYGTEKNINYDIPSWFVRPHTNQLASINEISEGSLCKRINTISDTIWETNDISDTGLSGNLYGTLNEGVNLERWLKHALFNQEIEGGDGELSISENKFSLYSPELEFDESLYSIINNLSVDFIGNTSIISNTGNITIQTSSSSINNGIGFITKQSISSDMGTSLSSGFFYHDGFVTREGDKYKFRDNGAVNYLVYPWQSSGSLNNDMRRHDDTTRTAVLKKKIIYNFKTCNGFSKVDNIQNFDYNFIHLFTDSSIIKDQKIIYDGNIDTVITTIKNDNHHRIWFNFELNRNRTSVSPIDPLYFNQNKYFTAEESEVLYLNTHVGCLDWNSKNTSQASTERGYYNFPTVNEYDSVNTNDIINKNDIDYRTKFEHKNLNIRDNNTVRIKFKSCPHLFVNTGSAFLEGNNEYKTYLHVAEIVRNNVTPTSLYGEVNENNLENHLWIPAGEAVNIEDDNTEITWKYGDTFYQRYDCLRIYPYSQEDENQIIDVVSFMCETRINIDGRYDKNKGISNNLFYITPNNYNLHNPVYNQLDSYFNYRVLDEDYYKNNKWNNMVCWSLPKHSMNEIDTWCSIKTTSSYKLSDNIGAINSINIHNDNIYLFQDNCISQLLYNSRVQVQSSENVPIEIANSGKVEGIRIISNSMGCNSFLQTFNTSSGVYFIDSVTKQLHHIGEQLQNISSTNNVASWFSKHNISNLWYDPINQDIYIKPIEGDVLRYSESMGKFTSFVGYHNADSLFYVDGNIYSLSKKIGIGLYENGKFNYNNFYGEILPSSLSFISNLDAAQDKIFSNIEFRADSYDGDIIDHKTFPFNNMIVENSYQNTGGILLNNVYTNKQETAQNNTRNTLRKKFRTWRVEIPRDKVNKRDRIRDFWTKITLSQTDDYAGKNFKLHDLNVIYYT